MRCYNSQRDENTIRYLSGDQEFDGDEALSTKAINSFLLNNRIFQKEFKQQCIGTLSATRIYQRLVVLAFEIRSFF